MGCPCKETYAKGARRLAPRRTLRAGQQHSWGLPCGADWLGGCGSIGGKAAAAPGWQTAYEGEVSGSSKKSGICSCRSSGRSRDRSRHLRLEQPQRRRRRLIERTCKHTCGAPPGQQQEQEQHRLGSSSSSSSTAGWAGMLQSRAARICDLACADWRPAASGMCPLGSGNSRGADLAAARATDGAP